MIAKPARTLAVVALLLGAAGCSDDSSSEVGPEPAPTTSSVASTATPSDPTSTADPTDATAELAFPGVAPADGMELKQKTASVYVPPGWTRAPSLVGIGTGAGRRSYDLVSFTDQDQFGSFPDMSTDDLTKVLMRGNRQMGGTYERADDVVVDGFPVVRITGVDRNGLVEEQYAASREGRLVTLTITITKAGVRQDPDLIPSVVNSWTWR